MTRVLCTIGFHAYRRAVTYKVRGHEWGTERCARCRIDRDFVR
jgi:hypothetical protein